jgi:hypothetical protein
MTQRRLYLDKLAALALSTEGYMIEVAGYASKTEGKRQTNNSARIVQPQSQIIFASTTTSQCGGYLHQQDSVPPIF